MLGARAEDDGDEAHEDVARSCGAQLELLKNVDQLDWVYERRLLDRIFGTKADTICQFQR